jgi:hypothetical protein
MFVVLCGLAKTGVRFSSRGQQIAAKCTKGQGVAAMRSGAVFLLLGRVAASAPIIGLGLSPCLSANANLLSSIPGWALVMARKAGIE